jgi:NAD dependent epimerase/dehydratase family enzyme
VHLDDVVGSLRFLADRPEIAGVVNVTSPNPTDDATLMRTLRRVLGIPFGLPLPRWALELGSAMIRTETELVLKSRWVLPERLSAAGYPFRYPELEGALRQIIGARGEAPVASR